MTPAASDERLVRRAAKGDERAFAAIFDRYHRDLYRFCLALVGRPEDAQDALQNTMVKVLRALPGERRPIQLKPWLYRIAHNEAIEVLRRRREGVELDPELHSAGAGPVESAAMRERLRGLFEDLAALPERQRAALVMRELGDLGFDQIGAAFETSEAVVRQTVYEARLSLRQMEAGREMSCESVMRQLSDADGRVTRRRDVRAHLRACPSCSAFRDGIAERRHDFAAIAPLPLAASAALLHGAMAAGGAGAAGAGGAAAAGAGAGGAAAATGAAGLAGSGVVKSVATVAVVAVVGTGAADRSGLVETPLPVGGSGAKSSGPEPGAGPAAPAAAAAEEGSSGEPTPRGKAGRTGVAAAAARRGAERVPPGKPASSRGKRALEGGSAPGKRPAPARNDRSEGSAPGRSEGAPPPRGHGRERAPGQRSGKKADRAGAKAKGKPDRTHRGQTRGKGGSRGAKGKSSRPPRRAEHGRGPKPERAKRPERQSTPPDSSGQAGDPATSGETTAPLADPGSGEQASGETSATAE